MSLKAKFGEMIAGIAEKYTIPPIADIFFPPFHKGGQPKDAQFMALRLESDATGISFVLTPDEEMEGYAALHRSDFIGKDPRGLALAFGHDDRIEEMISLAAINAICQHVMRETHFAMEPAPDSLGLLSPSAGDKIGMVGLFFGLTKAIKKVGAELVVIEKKESLKERYPDLPITMDAAELSTCNKILCTSTTLLNNSLDEILTHCSPDAFISIIGPTAGYFPDPLFARGVDVVGGRLVKNGALFLKLLEQKRRWGDTTRMTCFQKETYTSIL
jgi:uncharacterized protein (DUF4213/DUF364 family)